MTDRYSFKDVAAVFNLPESRLRYWAQTGFINPSVRAGGRSYYTFRDLIQVRAAKELLDAGASLQKVRKNLDSLRAILPEADYPASRMRILSDGETVVARAPDDVLFEPLSGQLVMDFSVDGLSAQIADILALPTSLRTAEIPTLVSGDAAGAAGARERDIERRLNECLDGWREAPPALPAIADTLLFSPLMDVFARDEDQRDASAASAGLDIRPVLAHPGRADEYRPVGDRAVHAYPLASQVKNDQVAPFPGAPIRPDRDRISTIDTLVASIADQLCGPESAASPASESAYQAFIRGCEAEEDGDLVTAAASYRRAIELQPTLSSAHTNLGHVHYRQGDLSGARAAFERALELEPAQPEARFNLAGLLEDAGDMERAIGHLQRVLWTHPRFADAHYNLARLLAREDRVEQAREHLTRYLQLDGEGVWSEQARGLLAALS